MEWDFKTLCINSCWKEVYIVDTCVVENLKETSVESKKQQTGIIVHVSIISNHKFPPIIKLQ